MIFEEFVVRVEECNGELFGREFRRREVEEHVGGGSPEMEEVVRLRQESEAAVPLRLQSLQAGGG